MWYGGLGFYFINEALGHSLRNLYVFPFSSFSPFSPLSDIFPDLLQWVRHGCQCHSHRQILQMFQKQVFLPSNETFRCLLFFHLFIYMKCTYQSCHQWVIHMQHVFQHWHHCVATPQSTPCYTDHCECRAKARHSWLCSAASPTPAKVLYPPSLTHPQALHPLSSCVCNCCLSY